jgi:ribonuclease E
LKDALRNDRARIQVGHISHFGLLEMSRQRLRQGVVEVSTMPCPVCQGMGHVRSTESVALMILRSIEDHLRTQGPADLTANASTEASLYILNHKRAYLRDIELRYGVTIVIQMDETVHGGTFALTRGATANAPAVAESKAIQMEPSHLAVAGEADEETVAEGDDRRPSRRKRRRRRGRGDLPAGHGMQNGAGSNGFEASGEDEPGEDDEEDDSPEGGRPEPAAIAGEVAANKDEDEGAFRRNRRRGRRGGRRHRDEAAYGTSVPGLGEQPDIAYDLNFPGRPPLGPIQQDQVSTDPLAQAAPQISSHVPDVTPLEHGVAAIAEPRGPGRVNRPLEAPEPKAAETAPAEPVSAAAAAVEPEPAEAVSEPAAVVEQPKHKPARTGPARKGWWQRSIG